MTQAGGHRPPATGHRPPATGHRPPAAGTWLVWALVALFAGSMVVVSQAGWNFPDAAWWTLLLLVSVVAWFWTRALWKRNQ